MRAVHAVRAGVAKLRSRGLSAYFCGYMQVFMVFVMASSLFFAVIYNIKLKKVKVPSNYEDLGEGVDGPLREDRHPGIWNGTFKTELEWTDNPAWILYDLILTIDMG